MLQSRYCTFVEGLRQPVVQRTRTYSDKHDLQHRPNPPFWLTTSGSKYVLQTASTILKERVEVSMSFAGQG